MSNKNENNFCIISDPGGLLKLDIMVRKANVLTHIWSFCENLENYINIYFMMRRFHVGRRYVK